MSRLLAFGEIMLRLSPPGRELLMQTPRLDVWVAGAEANVATQLARLGHDVRFASRVPDNDLGRAAIATLRGHGVDTSGIANRRRHAASGAMGSAPSITTCSSASQPPESPIATCSNARAPSRTCRAEARTRSPALVNVARRRERSKSGTSSAASSSRTR